MTDDRSLERAARSWLEQGPIQAPDRAVDAALALVQTTRQERDLVPWRFASMNPLPRLALVGVIAAVALGGLFYLLQPRSGNVGSPTPAPTPSAGSTPTAAAVATAPVNYADLAGWIVFEHWGNAPDGSTTTFDPDRRQIWLVHADGTGLHELAPGQPATGKASPDVSRDGSKVVFSSWDPTPQIWEVAIDGGTPRLVSTDCSGVHDECFETDPAYNGTATQVAFVRFSGATTAEIGVRDLQSGQVTLLDATSVALTDGELTQPSWSQDGREIVYQRNTGGTDGEHPATDSKLYVVNLDGSAPRLLPTPEGLPVGDPDWSPDGSSIVFSTSPVHESEGRAYGVVGIYSIHPDGTGLVKLCGPCDQSGVAPSWTPDGKQILFWGMRTFALMDADGRRIAAINRPKLTWFGDTLGYGYVAKLAATP